MANISQINGFGFYAQTASVALSTVSSSVTTVIRGSLSAASPYAYLTGISGYEPVARHEQLFAYDGVYLSSSFGSLRLHAPSVVVTGGFTGSLQGTATTASYISPTFISASAAASGFGSGGGGGAGTITQISPGPGIAVSNGTGPIVTITSTQVNSIGVTYAISLGYLMP
jgi:hypothetical protein